MSVVCLYGEQPNIYLENVMRPTSAERKPTKIIFLILPKTHIMDLAGPDQVFLEAIGYNANMSVEYCSITPRLYTSSELPFGPLKHFSKASYSPGDFIIIPGAELSLLQSKEFRSNIDLFEWLRTAHKEGVNLCSVCSGAFVLGAAGLLNGKRCTTHWKRTGELQKWFPAARVQENILYTVQDRIYTSAGIASGIDMALVIVEQLQGAHFAHKVAREMVIYTRRNGDENQQSEFMMHRNHIHSGIHAVQDHLDAHLSERASLFDLAEIACMSARNFTRIFKKETGTTVNEYVTILRKERIRQLLSNPDLTRKQIARQCGLKSERQVNRLMNSAA